MNLNVTVDIMEPAIQRPEFSFVTVARFTVSTVLLIPYPSSRMKLLHWQVIEAFKIEKDTLSEF
jgi:hypothetical protein